RSSSIRTSASETSRRASRAARTPAARQVVQLEAERPAERSPGRDQLAGTPFQPSAHPVSPRDAVEVTTLAPPEPPRAQLCEDLRMTVAQSLHHGHHALAQLQAVAGLVLTVQPITEYGKVEEHGASRERKPASEIEIGVPAQGDVDAAGVIERPPPDEGGLKEHGKPVPHDLADPEEAAVETLGERSRHDGRPMAYAVARHDPVAEDGVDIRARGEKCRQFPETAGKHEIVGVVEGEEAPAGLVDTGCPRPRDAA